MRFGRFTGGLLLAGVGVVCVFDCFRTEGSWGSDETMALAAGVVLALGGSLLAVSGARRWLGYVKVARAAARALERDHKINVADVCKSTGLGEKWVRKYIAKAQKEKTIPFGIAIEGGTIGAGTPARGAKCPACGSSEVAKLPDSGPLFRYTSDRSCMNCSAIWRPACPKWVAAIVAILSAALGLAASLGVIIGVGQGVPVFIIVGGFLGIAGVSGTLYGLATLAGMAGKQKMLQRGSGG